MKAVVIDGVEYTLKYGIRALFVFEQITGRPYDGNKMIDLYTLMYAMLVSGNQNFDASFDSFLDACEADPTLFRTFTEVLEEESKRQAVFLPASGEKKKRKRKGLV